MTYQEDSRQVYSDRVTLRLLMVGRRGVRNERAEFAHVVLTLHQAKFVERTVASGGNRNVGEALPTSKSCGATASRLRICSSPGQSVRAIRAVARVKEFSASRSNGQVRNRS